MESQGGQVIVEFVADTSQLDAGVQDINSQIASTGKASQQAAVVFTQSNAAMTDSMDQTSGAAKQLSDSFKAIPTKALNSTMQEAKTIMDSFGNSVTQLSSRQTMLRSQVRAMTNALGELRLAGKEGTKEFNDLQNATAKLDRELLISRGAVKQLAQEFGTLRAGSEAIHGINAAMQIGVGAQSLFATENEHVEKAMRSMIGVMLLANGVQEAANILKADSILRIKAIAAWETIAAESELFFAEASATAWAVATGGLVILVGLIAAFVVTMRNLTGQTIDYKEEVDKLNESYEWGNDILKTKIELLKILGVNSFQQQKELIENEIRMAQDKQALLNKVNGKLSSEQQKQWDEAVKGEREAGDKLNLLMAKHAQDEIELKKETENRITEITKFGIERQQILFDRETIELEKKLRERGATEEQVQILADERLVKWLEVRRKQRLADLEATHKAVLAATEKNSTEEMQAQIALAGDARDKVTMDPNASDAAKLEARAEYENKTTEIIQQFADKNIKVIQDYEKKVLNERIEGLEQQRYIEVKGSVEDLALLKQIDAQKLLLAKVGHKMTTQETNLFLETQREAYFKYLGDIEIKQKDADEKAIKQIETNRIKQTSIQEKFHLSQSDVDEKFAKEREAHPEETDAEVYAAIEKPLELKREAEKKAAEESIKLAKQVSDDIFKAEEERIKANYDLTIRNLEKQKDFELNNNNLSNAQKLAVQKKFDREIAATKLAEWKAEQKMKEEQAAINGLVAITTFMASTPMTIGPIPNPAFYIGLAGTIAATTANVAAIAAMRPPAFAEGTPQGKPGVPQGMAIVGERGPELIYNHTAGARIVTAEDTARILSNYEIPTVSDETILNVNRSVSNSTVIDYTKLAKSFAEEIKKNPSAHINLDKSGFTSFIMQGKSKFEKVNNKFKA